MISGASTPICRPPRRLCAICATIESNDSGVTAMSQSGQCCTASFTNSSRRKCVHLGLRGYRALAAAAADALLDRDRGAMP